MKKTTLPTASPSFTLFMTSLCFGFLGLILPWSSAYLSILHAGTSLPNKMGHPLSFWQTSFLALAFRYAPCRTLIVMQANTPQGNILNFVQRMGFFALFILVSLWLVFTWRNRNILTQPQKKLLFRTSLLVISISALIVVRMATFADCSLIMSIELLDVHFSWTVLFFPASAMFYGILAIITSRKMSKETVSA